MGYKNPPYVLMNIFMNVVKHKFFLIVKMHTYTWTFSILSLSHGIWYRNIYIYIYIYMAGGPCNSEDIKWWGLTQWDRVTHICVGNLTIIGSDNITWIQNYLNQSWNIVNWTLRNKLLWKLNRNANIFSEENAFEISSAKCPFHLGLNVLMGPHPWRSYSN